MNPNVCTVIGTVSAEPFAVNERSGRRRRAGFQVSVLRKWWVQRLDDYDEATTVFDVKCRGYTALNVLHELNLDDRVVVCGHFEQDDGGLLELHADVVALAFSDEPRVADDVEDPEDGAS